MTQHPLVAMVAYFFRYAARHFEPRCCVIDGPRTPEGHVDPEAFKTGEAWICLRRTVMSFNTNVYEADKRLYWTASVPVCERHRAPWDSRTAKDRPMARKIAAAYMSWKGMHFGLDAGPAHGQCYRLSVYPFSWTYWGWYPSSPGQFWIGPLLVEWAVAR